MWLASSLSAALLRTTDSGNTWNTSTPLPSCAKRCNNALDCPTVTTCYLVPVGGPPASPSPITAVVTHDAGATWHSADIGPGGSSFLSDIACANAQDCRVVGINGIYGTSDGGTTWQKQAIEAEARDFPYLHAIACPAAEVCYAVGDEFIVATGPTAGGRARLIPRARA